PPTERGPVLRLRGLRRHRPGRRTGVPGLPGPGRASRGGNGGGDGPRRGRFRSAGEGGRPGARRTVRWAPWRSRDQHACSGASVLRAQGGRRALRGPHQRVGGAAWCSHPHPDAARRDGAGRSAGHLGRAGLPPARSGRPAPGRWHAGRPLRHRARRGPPRARRADRGAGARAGTTGAGTDSGGPGEVSGRSVVTDRTKPLYMIGVVAEMLKVHPQTLRFYEKKGLVRPGRTEGQTRMYSDEDLEEVARLLRLTRDLGVNLAGVEIVLKMRRRMIEMQKQIEDLLAYVRESGGEVREDVPREPREALVRSASNQLRSVDLF